MEHAALLATVSTGVVYGANAFCAHVQRPAPAPVGGATLTMVMGTVHCNGNRWMSAPGIVPNIAAAVSVIAAVAGHAVQSVTTGARAHELSLRQVAHLVQRPCARRHITAKPAKSFRVPCSTFYRAVARAGQPTTATPCS